MEQNFKRKIVLSEEDIAPILEVLQSQPEFVAFRKGALINDFLLKVQNSVREYVVRQTQDRQAFAQQQEQQPAYEQVAQDALNMYNEQLAKRMQRKDYSYNGQRPLPQNAVQQQPMPQQQMPQQPMPMTMSQNPVTPRMPAQTQQQTVTSNDEISFDDFTDDDL